MIKDIIEIYRIGKEIGLSNKEICSLFLFKNPRQRLSSTFFLIIIVVLTITTLAALIVFSYILIERNTYVTGSYYSTVKIKDFGLKRDKRGIK